MTKTRNGLLLLAGDGFSAFGTWIDFLAILTLAAYQFHVSPYQMAVVSAAGLLPGILAGPFIGRLCDRGNPKQILLASIFFRVIATSAILFCDDFLIFVALVSVRSVFAMVATPAINVMTIRLVDSADRPRFYSILNVLNNSAKVLAPAIGTVSSSLTSEAVALVMSLTFSAGAFVAFAFIQIAENEPTLTASGNTSAPIESPFLILVPLLWVATTTAFFVFMVNNLVPLVLQQSGFDKALLGLLVSSSGAGNILTGLWLAKRASSKPMRGELGEMLLPALLQAIGFGAIGMLLWLKPSNGAVILCMLFFVIGTVSARYSIAMSVHIAAHYSESIGKVWGVLQSWQNTMILAAPLVGAAILNSAGSTALFAFATGSAVLSFTFLLVLLKVGALRILR